MVWLFCWPTSSGTGLVVAESVSVVPSAMGMTPAVAGLVVRTIGPPVGAAVGSGGTRMLLVSVIELTSDASDWLCWRPAASVQWDVSVIRLNCGNAGSCSVVAEAKLPAPYQTLMAWVTVSELSPACTRAQSIQSVASPSQASG